MTMLVMVTRQKLRMEILIPIGIPIGEMRMVRVIGRRNFPNSSWLTWGQLSQSRLLFMCLVCVLIIIIGQMVTTNKALMAVPLTMKFI